MFKMRCEGKWFLLKGDMRDLSQACIRNITLRLKKTPTLHVMKIVVFL